MIGVRSFRVHWRMPLLWNILRCDAENYLTILGITYKTHNELIQKGRTNKRNEQKKQRRKKNLIMSLSSVNVFSTFDDVK